MNSRSQGFVLIIALSLMAIVVMLLLGVISLTRVEQATSNASRQQLQARMNARLAVMVGLGDLQKYAGADQRVTATADILVPPGDDPVTALSGGSVKWTGVWASNAAYNDPDEVRVTAGNLRRYRPDATASIHDLDRELGLVPAGARSPAPRWLVSGDDPEPTDRLTDEDSVVMVSVDEGLTARDGRLRQGIVRAPLETIPAASRAPEGRYAYWIGDEGVKARINMASPHVGAGGVRAGYEASLAQVADPSAIENHLRGDRRLFLRDALGESKWKTGRRLRVRGLLDSTSLPFMAEVTGPDEHDEILQMFFHDLTAHSESLITNTKRGGFKKDLTLALDARSPGMLAGPMFPPLSRIQDNIMDPGGPRWEQLSDYYNFSSNHPFSGGQVPMKTSPKAVRDGQYKNAHDQFNNRINIAPVVTRLQMVVQMFSQRKGSAAGPGTGSPDLASDYDYYFGFFPLVTLWNPYDQDMEIGDIMFLTQFSAHAELFDRSSGGKPSLGRVVTQWQHLDYFEDENRAGASFTVRPAAPVPAGESVTFTPAVNSLYAIERGSNTRRVIASRNVLTEGSGFSGDFLNGFFVPFVPGSNDGITRSSASREDVRWRLVKDGGQTAMDIWNLVTCFYSKVDDGKRVSGTDKFISMMHPGYGEVTKAKVIDVSELAALSGEAPFDFSSLRPETTAEDPERNRVSPFDLDALAELLGDQKKFRGFAVSFNFPKSPVEGDEEFKKIHFLSQMNPRSPLVMYGNRSLKNESDFIYRMYSGGEYRPWEENFRDNFNFGSGHVGLSTEEGPNRMILFEVPDEKPLSIGGLMHAGLLNVESVTNTAFANGGWRWNGNFQQPYNTPAYAIGNSFASIHMPPGATYHKIAKRGPAIPNYVKYVHGAHYDYSYLLNDLLWDDYFFSTNLEGGPEPDFPLPNSRIVKSEDHIPAEMTGHETAAANLMIEGGFNVNSTSVAAWSAVIGAMRDIDSLGAPQRDGSALRHNYSRFAEPAIGSTGEMPSYGSDIEEILSGFRFLSDAQVVRLATEIVREIKARRATHGYPFLSLSEFINRSIEEDDLNGRRARRRFTYLGALQHAIDQSGLNGIPGVDDRWQDRGDASGLWDDTVENGRSVYISNSGSISRAGYYDPESLESLRNRPYLDAAPGSFTQADLLAKIGSFLTPRSDTFTIRGYGQLADSLASGVPSKAYCEAVVQRTPLYCIERSASLAGNDKNDAPDALSETNLRFGRKFKILSFRWLEEGEI